MIQCAIKIDQNFVEKIVEDVAQNENAVAIVDILSNAVQFEFESKKNEMIQFITITTFKNKTNKKNKKSFSNRFKKLLIFFNIHAKLHLTVNAKKMTIMMNFNVFASELKHM